MFKRKMILLSLLIIGLLAFSSVSAGDVNETVVASENQNSDLIEIDDENANDFAVEEQEIYNIGATEENELSATPGTFTDLANEINLVDEESNLTRKHASEDVSHGLNVNVYEANHDIEVNIIEDEISEESIDYETSIMNIYFYDTLPGNILIFSNKELVDSIIPSKFDGEDYGVDEYGRWYYPINPIYLNIASHGNYEILVGYYDNGIFEEIKSFNLTVTGEGPIYNETYILKGVDILCYGNATYRATLTSSNGNPLKGKAIGFSLDGKTYKSKTNSLGVAMINFEDLTPGTHLIFASYLSTKTFNRIIVKGSGSSTPRPIINFTCNVSAYNGEENTYLKIVKNGDTYNFGEFIIIFNDNSYFGNLYYGETTVKVPSLNQGVYNYTIKYLINNIIHEYSSNFTILKKSSAINIDSNEFNFGEIPLIRYNLTSPATGNLSVYVDNQFIKNVDVGDEILLHGLNGGDHLVCVVYNGDNQYGSCEDTIN